MHRWTGPFCFVLAIALNVQVDAVESRHVDAALEKAKSWLYKQQANNTWERDFRNHGNQATGQTALVVYSLLSAGESHQDPRIMAAVDYLKKTDTSGIYALGMRCQVWLRLPPVADVRQAMSKDAQVLRSGMIGRGAGSGFYPYNTGATAWSLSRAQYAVLGMWAAASSGIEVPSTYWQAVEKAWIDSQDPSGGWAYRGKPTAEIPLTPGITAVGVATLFITQDYLHANDSIAGRGNIASPNIDKGMKWMIDNFDKVATNTAYARDYPYATLYAVERIGVASGLKYLGTINWYDKGAQWLLEKQNPDGSWPAEDHGAVANTCFAVLFLSRGRAPIAIDKLDYSMAGQRNSAPWNQRPRDAANITRWIGRQMEKEINWQIVNLSAPVEDWHDAPILYLSGGGELALDAAAKEKIKLFIEQGGLVLGNADAASRPFAASFRRLGQELFPAYEFRELPAEHVIYTNQQFPRARWRTKPSVLGLSNGVRELMLLIPQADVGRAWQTQTIAPREENWELASNIFLYSVESKVLRNRGDLHLVARDATIVDERSARLLRLKYNGNWDPEPVGWRRLSNILHNQYKLGLETQTVDPAKDSLGGAKIAHLTGTDKFKLDDAARQKIKAFVTGGGTLIIDAAGGASNFATAAEAEIAAMFPESPLTSLTREHAIFSAGGTLLKTIGYRQHASRILGALKDEPRLRAIELNGRAAVIFSREDLSAGMVGNAVDGIVGYDPATASQIMARVVLYAVQ